MRAFFSRLLDIIAPRKERLIGLDRYTLTDLNPEPMTSSCDDIDIISLASYRTQALADCIKALKYDGDRRAARLLSGLLAGYLREALLEERVLSGRPVVLVPVPLHPRRERERGFNQIVRVLESLPAGFADGSLARIELRMLSRTRDTPSQTTRSREERIRNVDGAFALSGTADARARVILVDDVTTTGATLVSAARPLIAAGIPVTTIALARA